MSTQNVDAEEIGKFDALAHRWWDPNGDFKPLHDIWMIGCEILPLADVDNGVIKLHRIRRRFSLRRISAAALAFGPWIEFPFAGTNRTGAVHQDV